MVTTSSVIKLKGVVTFDPAKEYQDEADLLAQDQMRAAGFSPGEVGLFSGGQLETKLHAHHLQNALDRIGNAGIAQMVVHMQVDRLMADIERLINGVGEEEIRNGICATTYASE